MATFNKVNSFVEALAEKVHNLGSDTLKIALTNTTPDDSWTKLADLTEISYVYLSDRTITVTTSAQTSGTYKLIISDITLTSNGGSTGAFRYIYIYNDTATNKELIGYFDYGSTLTLTTGSSMTLDSDQVAGIINIS